MPNWGVYSHTQCNSKRRLRVSHVYDEVTSEPTIMRYTTIVRKALKVLISDITNTQCGKPMSHGTHQCHSHFCPDSFQHVPVYVCHSDDDVLSQFLKIIWQGWYTDDVFGILSEKEVAQCEVW
jgi:hypothetical protein